MDVLSDVVTVARTGRPRSAYVRWHAPWAQRFAPVPGSAGFQVVLEGGCWLLRPDAEPLELGTGDVLFLPNGTGHTLADHPGTAVAPSACSPDDPEPLPRYAEAGGGDGDSDGDGPATVLLCGAYRLDPARTHPLLLTLPDTVHLPADPERHPELHAALRLLAAELGEPRLGGDVAVPALLDALLMYILRIGFAEPPAGGGRATGWAAALGDPAVTAALHAVHRDPAAPWTVASLAAEAGLSRAAFARRFRATTGRPPLGYLTWWRLTRAARLLRETEAPLRAVAAQVGYASEFAFAHAFKRVHGLAPGAYRRTG
ncbi:MULTISPECIES: AraC family transcriptional regulator [Kitasatospora]|uniref:Putative AraC family transcriptional regulator n=1 Tax=Kitasatospora setae (strain ATCC 33774 / DSM 43861 / JCM 3304 / KCC A-0304 / NBRC 14216 / KM-6054) TaxID=452652 RepID=E4NJI4_KITSK|nr:AraC family transcriptional regulator [Kitasatospora setae]BAJ33132.1 putative AraC family transcriptional regulator [Kitasatospora setae KM-6054]